MHTNPVSATNPIIPFSPPVAGAPTSSLDLYKMIGGMKIDMAQQHTPPTSPSTAPKFGTLHARYAARATNPVRMRQRQRKRRLFPRTRDVFQNQKRRSSHERER